MKKEKELRFTLIIIGIIMLLMLAFGYWIVIRTAPKFGTHAVAISDNEELNFDKNERYFYPNRLHLSLNKPVALVKDELSKASKEFDFAPNEMQMNDLSSKEIDIEFKSNSTEQQLIRTAIKIEENYDFVDSANLIYLTRENQSEHIEDIDDFTPSIF